MNAIISKMMIVNFKFRIQLTLILITLMFTSVTGQEQPALPYEAIPEYPNEYSAGTVVSRMIDGLGFRYYWATESLSEEDLLYKPSPSNRTIGETLDHIHNLARVIYNSAMQIANDPATTPENPVSFGEKRSGTLHYFAKASEVFKTTKDLSAHEVIFIRNGEKTAFPFWNQINGPIEDAVWHCGQIVTMRRAAGNPIDPNVSVFRGVRREK